MTEVFTFCRRCDTYHGEMPLVSDMLEGRAPMICCKCDSQVNRGFHNETMCAARAEAARMCRAGLMSTRRGWTEPTGVANIAWTRAGFIKHASSSGAKYAFDALKRFDERAELVRSFYANKGTRFECWTDQHGMDTLLLIQWTSRQLDGGTGLSVPEMARRLAQHQDLFVEFRAAYVLGASENDLLGMIYKPILKGPEFKKRPVQCR